MFNRIHHTNPTITSGATDTHPIHFKYFPVILVLFASILLTANVAALKLVDIYGLTFTGGFIVYPFSYILNCITVEVYGYKNARLSIWCGFILCFVFVFFIDIVAYLPPSQHWHLNEEFKQVLVPETRIIGASLISFLIGDFINSYLIARSKNKGEALFKRIMKAAFISILIGIIIFIFLGYYGSVPNDVLIELTTLAFLKKIALQILFFPFTAYMITLLKRVEGIDLYDFKTDFNPFSLDNVYHLQDYRERE